MNGELWRLITGNFIHLGWSHLLLNLAALLLLSSLLKFFYNSFEVSLIALFSAGGVGLGLLFFAPEVAWYVGLSGLLHGMLAAVIIAGLKQKLRGAFILGLLLTAKLALESSGGSFSLFTFLSTENVISQAHLYGAVSGLIVSIAIEMSKRRKLELG